MDEVDDVVDVVLREEIAVPDPARRAPFQGIELDVGVAQLGLLHQPPLIAARIVLIARAPHMGGFRAIGGVLVAADFDLQMLDVGAVVGFKEIVQDLAALGLRIVDQQSRRRAGADRAQPLVNPAAARTGQGDVLRVRSGYGQRGDRLRRFTDSGSADPRNRPRRQQPVNDQLVGGRGHIDFAVGDGGRAQMVRSCRARRGAAVPIAVPQLYRYIRCVKRPQRARDRRNTRRSARRSGPHDSRSGWRSRWPKYSAQRHRAQPPCSSRLDRQPARRPTNGYLFRRSSPLQTYSDSLAWLFSASPPENRPAASPDMESTIGQALRRIQFHAASAKLQNSVADTVPGAGVNESSRNRRRAPRGRASDFAPQSAAMWRHRTRRSSRFRIRRRPFRSPAAVPNSALVWRGSKVLIPTPSLNQDRAVRLLRPREKIQSVQLVHRRPGLHHQGDRV